jgi:hypothetical protein
MSNQWFLTYVPFEEVSGDKRSQTMFSNAETATKDAVGEVSFRGRLAHSCENEFNISVKNVSIDYYYYYF